MKKRVVLIIIAVLIAGAVVLTGYIAVKKIMPAIADVIKNVVQNIINELVRTMFSGKNKSEAAAVIENGRRLLICLSLI